MRYTGIDFTDHEPWWASGIRDWLLRAEAILNSTASGADAWRAGLITLLERGDPHLLYSYHAQWAFRIEH